MCEIAAVSHERTVSCCFAAVQAVMNNPVICNNRTSHTLVYSGARCGPTKQQLQWTSAVDPVSNCTFVPAKGRSTQSSFFNLNLFGSCGVTPGKVATTVESVVCKVSQG